MTEGAELKREMTSSLLLHPSRRQGHAESRARAACLLLLHGGVSFTNLLPLLAVDNGSRCLAGCIKEELCF